MAALVLAWSRLWRPLWWAGKLWAAAKRLDEARDVRDDLAECKQRLASSGGNATAAAHWGGRIEQCERVLRVGRYNRCP